MADRLRALQRIETVQGRMVRLAEARVAEAERRAREMATRAEGLRDYLAGPSAGPSSDPAAGPAGYLGGGTVLPASPLDQALGSSLSRAALRSLGDAGRAQVEAERETAERLAALGTLRRRGGAIEAAVARAATQARRAGEARDLAAVMEAWLAAGGKD